jgi:hypothetical protein
VKKTRRPLSEWGGGVTHDDIFRLEQVNHHLGIGKAPFREMDGDKTIWCVALHYTTLHYTTLRYATLRYATLHYTTLHYTTLHYTTLHYTTSLGASAALVLFASSERL